MNIYELKELYYSKLKKRIDKIEHIYSKDINEEIEASLQNETNLLYFSISKVEKLIRSSDINSDEFNNLFNVYRDLLKISYILSKIEEKNTWRDL